MELGLRGRPAVVTGASRGIGRAIALGLAREGCDVAICARQAEEVEATLGELRELGVTAYGAPVDIVDADALQGFIDDAAEALGGLELLVACAGGQSSGPKLPTIGADDWRRTLDLNVTHPAIATVAARPHMAARGQGAIVFIASVAGMHPWTRSHYGAAKAAEIHLAQSLARELGPDQIRVNVISPGSIIFPTSAWQRVKEQDEERFADWIEHEFPLGRLGTDDEVADVACFLLSQRAAWVSGANIAVDGAQNPPNMLSTMPLPGRWRA